MTLAFAWGSVLSSASQRTGCGLMQPRHSTARASRPMFYEFAVKLTKCNPISVRHPALPPIVGHALAILMLSTYLSDSHQIFTVIFSPLLILDVSMNYVQVGTIILKLVETWCKIINHFRKTCMKYLLFINIIIAFQLATSKSSYCLNRCVTNARAAVVTAIKHVAAPSQQWTCKRI